MGNKLDSSGKKTTKQSRKKMTKKQKLIYNIILAILVCLFLGSAIYLINYFYKTYKSENRYEELRDMIVVDSSQPEQIEIIDEENVKEAVETAQVVSYTEVNGVKVLTEYSELYKINNDFYGWIKIGDTVIDYPVMHHPTDNNYYLHRDFDKNWSDPGTIYVDTRCDIETPGDNLIIYGHNMKSGKMFASLFRFEKEEYYKKYKYIRFDTIHEKAIYEIIAAFRTEIYPEDYTGFKYYEYLNISNETSFNNYVENCRRLTPYETSSAEYGDKLITLSTCAYHDENGRYVVVAKKVLK